MSQAAKVESFWKILMGVFSLLFCLDDNEGLASFGMRQGRLDCNHPEIVVPEPDLRTAIVESNMLN